MLFFIVVVIQILCLSVTETYGEDSIYVSRMDDFSKRNKSTIALHFPCLESNKFSTNCACHLICTDPACNNAINLCRKYQKTFNCQYVLLRGGVNNKFATLKRSPSAVELEQLSISEFQLPSNTSSTSKTTTAMLSTMSFKDMLQYKDVSDSFTSIKNQMSMNKEPMCGITNHSKNSLGNNDDDDFLQQGITLVIISYRSPLTLANSMRTWNSSGLLSLMKYRIAILSKPLPEEIIMSQAFGFQVIQPNDIPQRHMIRPNVFTIGAAFYYGLQHAKTEYVLFLENDFKIDTGLSKTHIMKELLGGVAMLKGGAEVVRLLSRKDKGCGTFLDCDQPKFQLKQSSTPTERNKNWFAFYCRDYPNTEHLVKDCLVNSNCDSKSNIVSDSLNSNAAAVPEFRCFTSQDSNWSLNAALIKKSTMMNKKYKNSQGIYHSITDIGLIHWQKQDGFESDMAFGSNGNQWLNWKVPICNSYNGLFLHQEIETSA